MSKRYLIANWKMNLPPEGIGRFVEVMTAADAGDVTIVIAPPFPYLKDISGFAVAGQNCNDHPSGAFTGEVAPAMLKECGARAVILGHSERRQLYGESDALIARKLTIATENGLLPVLCIGEDLKVRDAGHVSRFLAEQIKATAVAALEGAGEIVIAYEPIWAIGTGRTASADMVAETLVEIRSAVTRFWPARHASVPILYGGSVTPENAAELAKQGTIDGFLVGGASLDSARFTAILRGLTQ